MNSCQGMGSTKFLNNLAKLGGRISPCFFSLTDFADAAVQQTLLPYSLQSLVKVILEYLKAPQTIFPPSWELILDGSEGIFLFLKGVVHEFEIDVEGLRWFFGEFIIIFTDSAYHMLKIFFVPNCSAHHLLIVFWLLVISDWCFSPVAVLQSLNLRF